jgi:hypothetical protein
MHKSCSRRPLVRNPWPGPAHLFGAPGAPPAGAAASEKGRQRSGAPCHVCRRMDGRTDTFGRAEDTRGQHRRRRTDAEGLGVREKSPRPPLPPRPSAALFRVLRCAAAGVDPLLADAASLQEQGNWYMYLTGRARPWPLGGHNVRSRRTGPCCRFARAPIRFPGGGGGGGGPLEGSPFRPPSVALGRGRGTAMRAHSRGAWSSTAVRRCSQRCRSSGPRGFAHTLV